MRFLSNGSDDEYNQNLAPRDYVRVPDSPSQPYVHGPAPDQEAAPSFNFRILLRKYWLLLLSLIVLGALAGFVSVVLSSPMYRTRLLLELQSSSGTLAKNESNYEVSDVGIQTQVALLQNGGFLKHAAERMQSDTVPLAPTGQDIFSRLRQRIHPATQDPLEAYKVGLQTALVNFQARPVNKTRLIEMSCESTSPNVASDFLNAMADEVLADNSRARSETARKTGEWLEQQIDEAKSRVREAEDRLQEFVQVSGNAFAGQDPNGTLDDTKLAHLKGELSRIQADRIARETRYEQTLKASPENVADVLDDGVLRGYKAQLEELKREKAKLETVYTPKHEKVRQLDAQIMVVQKSYETELNSVLKRIKNDYEAALKQEKLLSNAYNGQAQRVGSEAGKAAQFGALRREVETQRQGYQNLLIQKSEVGLSGSVPVSPIRIVERSSPPEFPYKPQPVLNISFGIVLGLALTAGLVFLRERADQSIKAPGMSRRIFNTPELGVIPSISLNGAAPAKLLPGRGKGSENGIPEDVALTPNGQRFPGFITESFRSTLASILRSQATGRAYKIILVTSPGPGEGKTTVVQNLGIVLAETGRKVLLLDADFRRPHLHRKFGLPNERGLVDVLCEDSPLSEYMPEQLEVPSGIPGLYILPNRVTQNNVAKALYSPRLRPVFESLINRYDMVLVDAPPILSIADARIIAPLADGLILVLRCGKTDREAAVAAYQRIQDDGLSLLGSVLTDYDTNMGRNRHYYYDYGYGTSTRS